ncbi:TSUP family transporter [Bradyrhizobium sp. WSM2793]|uniref:TSUP family transporter n=1 Tax=Bradyrhizobium sp. WSM2793 TaxID=1038866 RepID=UPI00036F490F|nr:TSUP family transporter [Bradyrhizobium sp. WSM2793]
MDVFVFTVFALAALVGGFVSGFSGFAMGLVVSGVWLHIITPMQTATLIAGYGLLTQGYGIYKLRHVLDLRKAWPLALGTVIGIPIGVGILAYLNPVYLRLGVGVLLLIYAIYGLTRPVFAPMKIGTGTDIAIGISNGMLGGRAVFQPVLFVAFVVISLSQAAAGTITKETLMLYALGVPFMAAGLWSGFKLFGTIDDETFRKAVLALLLFAGVSLVVSTLPFSFR